MTAALVGCVAALLSSVPSRPPEPRVFISAYPRASQAPSQVRLTTRVHDQGQELQCPAFSWSWGDGSGGGWVPYCDPYEQPGERLRLWTVERKHVYRLAGTYEIESRVIAGDRVLRATVTVQVAGRRLMARGGDR